jgi:hypothetical protein
VRLSAWAEFYSPNLGADLAINSGRGLLGEG